MSNPTINTHSGSVEQMKSNPRLSPVSSARIRGDEDKTPLSKIKQDVAAEMALLQAEVVAAAAIISAATSSRKEGCARTPEGQVTCRAGDTRVVGMSNVQNERVAAFTRQMLAEMHPQQQGTQKDGYLLG